MDDEVYTSSSKMMNSAVFGQIIILIVYLPILTLEGIEGKMFKPMAQTVIFALIGAFILSLTYVPMMSSLFLSKKLEKKRRFSDKMMEKIESLYHYSLNKVLKIPILYFRCCRLIFHRIFVMTRLGGNLSQVFPKEILLWIPEFCQEVI
jgi:cobalt-zinc-cadmium resistance protein CzcA